MLPIHTIVHPTNFSEHAMHAFHVACALARDYHAHLVIVHVMSEPLFMYPPGEPPSIDEFRREELRDKLNSVQPKSGVTATHALEEGDPAEEILNLADLTHADLIVMGTRGRRGLPGLVTRSVTEKVLREAKCPVLTIRLPFPGVEPVSAEQFAGEAVAAS